MSDNQEATCNEGVAAECGFSSLSPIVVFGFIHKAILEELLKLCHDVSVSFGVSEIQQISGRYAFIRFITKHHFSAQKEAMHSVFDLQITAEPSSCSVQHEIDIIFSKLFGTLNSTSYLNEGGFPLLSKELVYYTHMIFSRLSEHLLNEERQAFPLLCGHFSSSEQASIVWTYISSIPVVLMEKFLPWLMSFLSPKERKNMLKCMQKVVPEDMLLHEVISTWLEEQDLGKFMAYHQNKHANSSEELYNTYVASILTKRGIQSSNVTKLTNRMCKRLLLPECELFKPNVLNLLKTELLKIIYWREAVEKELKEIVGEAYKMRHSGDYSNFPSFVDRLHFLVEICVFHSALNDNALIQAMHWKDRNCTPLSNYRTPKETSTKRIQTLLNGIANVRSNINSYDLFYQFCMQLDMLIERIKQALFVDPEASPIVHEALSIEKERSLLLQSLCMMPLRLLERVLPWLYNGLSSKDAKQEMLHNMHLAAPADDVALVRLFTKWACKGYTEDCFKLKTNMVYLNNKIGCFSMSRMKNVTHMGFYKSSIYEKQGNYSGCRYMYQRPSKQPHSLVKDIEKAVKTCGCQISKDSNISKLKIFNLQVAATNSSKLITCSPSSDLKRNTLISSSTYHMRCTKSEQEGKHAFTPINIIFLCHKAIRNDLDYLDGISSKLQIFSGNIAFEMSKHFHLFKDLYEAHSKAEDEFVFPSLEANNVFHDAICSFLENHSEEKRLLEKLSGLLLQLIKLHDEMVGNTSSLSSDNTYPLLGDQMEKCHKISANIQAMYKHLRVTLERHLQYEEWELWPLFDRYISMEEQNKILGYVLGNTGAEMLQKLLLWVTASLTQEEKDIMFSTLKHTTRNTMLTDWLDSWWKEPTKTLPSVLYCSAFPYPPTMDSLQMVANYLYYRSETIAGRSTESGTSAKKPRHTICVQENNGRSFHNQKCMHYTVSVIDNNKQHAVEVNSLLDSHKQKRKQCQTLEPNWKDLLTLNEQELAAALRKISSDDSLDHSKKRYLMQTLMARNWIVSQQKFCETQSQQLLENAELARSPSYRDEHKTIFGCEHYKRNCKIVASCCGKLYTCRQCHDKVSDHVMDRRTTKEMMCMECLCIQPIGPNCATPSCKGLSMARYFCNICKFFEDERKVYHCPFCNICRVGQGLGVDYFHCMKCNACMSISLRKHKCHEKDLESNCPICLDFMFTSVKPVKALSCGHSMHSACFKEYSCTEYKCPICSKSMGDMTVYFGMLDALLAAEELPEKFRGQKQDIYCNDCEKKGTAPFHWLYHKCNACGSYNTKLINDGAFYRGN